jgi:hypothetical protein
LMTIEEASNRIGKSRNVLYQRLFCNKRTSWDSDNIFADSIPKTKDFTPRFEIPRPEALPGKRIMREIETIKIGTWERRDKVATRFRREMTLKNLPARDRDYNDALKFNRAVCR